VKLISEKLTNELAGKLRYLDTAVLPATQSLDLTYAALYEHISQDKTCAGNAWTISSKADFAKTFNVSRSTLSVQDKSRKGSRE